MTINVSNQSRSTVTETGTVAQHAPIAPPEEYVPLTADGLLLFCQSRLQDMDTRIQAKMKGQESLVGLQDGLTEIQAMVKAGDGNVNPDSAVAFDSKATVEKVTKQIDATIADANANGNPTLAKNLEDVKTKLLTGKDGNDNKVTKEEVKDISTMLDNAISTCRSGAELSMIELQSLVSKRATTLQLTTGMMNSIDEAPKAIAANVGR